MSSKALPVILLLTITVALSACSFSKSSESGSDSSKSLFDLASSPLSASSDSSGDAQQKFENDVADFTAEFIVASTGTMDDFREHLGELAEQHGITHWEGDRHTFLGIGRGLKKAKIGKPQISAFTESMSGNDPLKKQGIEDGLKQ